MKLLLDACVLYPTVMREVLLAAAKTGAFTPLWSERILEEWRRAALKLGPEGAAQAESDITMARVHWPKAAITYPESLEARLYLPDPADTHVLAAAIAGNADQIVTLNAKDFPRNILAEEGLKRIDPDTLLIELHAQTPQAIQDAIEIVHTTANRLSGKTWDRRALLKKARLPRLGKALAQ